jgi:hypothetical protein
MPTNPDPHDHAPDPNLNPDADVDVDADTNIDAEAELERQARRDRRFSLPEAIGRLAGPGMMKGISPVARERQIEAEIQDHLTRHLTDSEGALSRVLLRQISQSEPLLNTRAQPLAVLAAHIAETLDSPHLLSELVREADVEWGRIYDERPHFTPPDPSSRPHPDDPYTLDSVRAQLAALLETLSP